MDGTQESGSPSGPGPGLGLRAAVLIVALHLAAVAVATYPALPGFFTRVPRNLDAWQHLGTLRWYRSWLTEGRPTSLHHGLQYPFGMRLGSLSPLHMQAAVFLPVSLVTGSDVVAYNTTWLFGLLVTGFGTSLLAWHLLRDRAAAAFAGVLAVLSAPVMIHASAHLELVYVGGFPVFLVAWMRLVDAPGRGRMVAAAAAYVAVAMCAAYFMVYAVFPAFLYLVWSWWRSPSGEGAWRWLGRRVPWLAGMAALSLPCVVALFWDQFALLSGGGAPQRNRVEYDMYGAPAWGFATPSHLHLLARWWGAHPYRALGASAMERVPYLGVVTVALLAYAAAARVRVGKRSYLWLTCAMLAVLALGSRARIGSWEVSLPSGWLWDLFPPIRKTRVPARWALFLGVPAGVLAAAALKDLLGRLPGRPLRAVAFAAVTALAVADLATVGFPKEPIPAVPGGFAFIGRIDPRATVLEIPFDDPREVCGLSNYWHSFHKLRTSAGYSGYPNVRQHALLGFNSPFRSSAMKAPDYLRDPARFPVELDLTADFRDYVWLYLTANRFDYVILHLDHTSIDPKSPGLARLRRALAGCRVYEDAGSVVYARSRMAPPTRPVQLTRDGWVDPRPAVGAPGVRLPGTGRLAVYSPDPGTDLTLGLEATADRTPHEVGVFDGGRELARWVVHPGPFQVVLSPPFRLPTGVHDLTVTSREVAPAGPVRSGGGPADPLRVCAVKVVPTPRPAEATAVRDLGAGRVRR